MPESTETLRLFIHIEGATATTIKASKCVVDAADSPSAWCDFALEAPVPEAPLFATLMFGLMVLASLKKVHRGN